MAKLKVLFLYIVIYYLIFPHFAYAYLDPGTGSYVFQLVLAFFVGSLYFIKLYWIKIITFIHNLFKKRNGK